MYQVRDKHWSFGKDNKNKKRVCKLDEVSTAVLFPLRKCTCYNKIMLFLTSYRNCMKFWKPTKEMPSEN